MIHFPKKLIAHSAIGDMRSIRPWLIGLFATLICSNLFGQSVCLPSPRLLTIFPMGGQVGQTVDVTVGGENLDELSGLIFSDPRIVAAPATDEKQQVIPNRFRISIPADMSPGIVEAFAVARLGVSSSRVFSIGQLAEVVQAKPSSSIKDAITIEANSTLNATMIAKGMNHYRFSARAGQSVRIDCSSRSIESKLDPVIVLSTSSGKVLATDRLANGINVRIENDDEYLIKVHDLTFQGGPEFFYRLSVQTVLPTSEPIQFASIKHVAQYSWPPMNYDYAMSKAEAEPNAIDQPQQIELPYQVSGSFYPAADVDCFTFQAKKGENWWIEIASHRMGAPTGPAAIVQQSVNVEGKSTWRDVLEIKDIPSPMKVSSNHYAYDGPPYNGGSTDLIGMLNIPEDGLYRLQLNDLFGGTRINPACVYQLIIRPASPDFALTGWVKHVELRNGDRNALSKPLALRPGATIALEIGAFRRDGFDKPIHLEVSGLPDGVTATAVDIAANQTSGTVFLTAGNQTPKGIGSIKIAGHSEIDGATATRPCQLSSMSWPIRDHWQEFPRPRLLQQVPVSVTDAEPATITIQPPADENGNFRIKATAGTVVKVPLKIERRSEFSGSVLALQTLGNGFQQVPRFEIALQENQAEAKLDLAALKIAPGSYTIAFYGPAVAKYRDYPQAVTKAEQVQKAAATSVEQLKQQLQSLKQTAQQGDSKLASVEQELKNAEANLAAADSPVKTATARSQPQDIADIVVTQPWTLEVLPPEEKK